MVEGALQHVHRHAEDRVGGLIYFRAARQLACVNTHHRHALRRKPFVAVDVALRSVTHLMSNSISLDRKTRLCTIEIEHIRPNGMLSPKNRPTRHARTQKPP